MALSRRYKEGSALELALLKCHMSFGDESRLTHFRNVLSLHQGRSCVSYNGIYAIKMSG